MDKGDILKRMAYIDGQLDGDELEEFERELSEDERQAILAEKRLDTCIIETIKQATEKCPDPLWDKVVSNLQDRTSYGGRLALRLPWLRWKPSLGLAAAVGLVTAGIFFGKWIWTQDSASRSAPDSTISVSPQASKRLALLEERTQHCLQKSEVLLLALANFDPQTDDAMTLNLPYQRRISEALVKEASYLKSELSEPAERRLQDLISDLEVILLQIANLEDEYDLQDVEMLRSGVNKRGILFRIDLSRMSGRMQDAFQDETPAATNSSQI
jgi:hypothetical protein